MAVKRHRQNDPISPSSPNTKKRVFRRSTCLSFGALLASTADPQHWADPPCAPQRRPSVALNAFPLCRTGFWGKNTGSELGPETIQWGTSTLFDIMAELTRGWYRENMFHDGERSCKKKKTTVFWPVFHRESNNFRGALFRGALQSVGANATMCLVAGAGQGPRDPGLGTHCRPRLRGTENHMLKVENSGVGAGAGWAKGGRRRDRAVSMCPSPSPGPSSPHSPSRRP